MSDVTFTGCTGEGHETIASGWVDVHTVNVRITAAVGKTRLIGTPAVPRSVRYAGHVGLGVFSDTGDVPDDPISLYEWRIDREYADYGWPHMNNVTNYARAVYWRLAPGVTADINVQWGA